MIQEKGWGSRTEKVKFCSLLMISSFLPPELKFLCNDEVIKDIEGIHNTILDDEDLNILVGTLPTAYRQKMKDVRDNVMQRLKEEAIIINNSTKK